jgi:NAD(P)-dependent dehydrogenase (short-subunit alcohol dehydrogenase family)
VARHEAAAAARRAEAQPAGLSRAGRAVISIGISTGTGRLAGRIALVTGASRGIGAAIAVRFAEEGAHLVLAARTVGGLEEVDDRVRAAAGGATLVPFDLRDFIKIDELAAALYERYGRLDILVGNAAEFGVFSPMGDIDPKLWGEIIDLNLTANWRLIRAMGPLLRAAPAGRAIFLTSRLARDALPYYGPYAVAKAGLETLVRIYAGEIARTNVRVNLFDPGVVRTRLRARIFPGENPATLPAPESVADAVLDLALPECTRNGEIVSLQQT